MLSTGKSRFEFKSLWVRLLLWAVIVVAGAFALYFSISYVAIPLLVWLSPTLNPTLYELGFYGGSPSQTYVSNGLSSPRISTRKYDDACDRGYTFLSFNGDSIQTKGPAILNADNELIWKAEQFGASTNVKLQNYKGEQFLTFWAGHKSGSKGRGVYYLVSLHKSWNANLVNKDSVG